MNVWEQFYWCTSGCNHYHQRPHSGSHYSMVPGPQEPPNEHNWPGTAQERARYAAWMELRRIDKDIADAAMNARIDRLATT